MTTIAPGVDDVTDQTTYFGQPPMRPQREELFHSASTAPTQTAADIQCLCPFCGEFNAEVAKPCVHCNQEDTIAARAAATRRVGSWFVRQTQNPSAPGISFDDLRLLIQQQIVTNRSVVRGPATGQLWRLAGTVRGVGREFGQCYSCGGDIETDETICPHCERTQTVQDSTRRIPSPPAMPAPNKQPFARREPFLTPEVAGPAREALLAEPTIRVHSLAHPEEFIAEQEEVSTSRPVIAERTERHIPKDDLLTPRDLAKAFQLEFGMQDNVHDRYKIPGQTARQIKIALSGTGALAVAFLLGMQAIHVMSDRPIRHRTAAASTAPKASPIAVPNLAAVLSDAQLASNLVPAQGQPVIQSPAPVIAPAPVSPPVAIKVAPQTTPAPVVAIAPAPLFVPAITMPKIMLPTVTPIMLVTPPPVATSDNEDDPTALLNAGLIAESNGNYAAAIRDYERIQSLPSSQWPPRLSTRLQLARRELKGDLR